jgi:hypothetical protein
MQSVTDFYARRARLIAGDKKIEGRPGNARGPRMGAQDNPVQRIESSLVFGSRYGKAPALEGPITFVWEVPTEFARVEVPFEFTNLPLP